MSAPSSASKPIREIILAHPLFNGLNPRHLPSLENCAAWERFGAAQDIFREGQSADRFFLIHQGRVALEMFVPRIGPVTVQTIEAGGALGWSWLYPPYQWQFNARALDPVEAVTFRAAGLREQIERDPEFGRDLLRRVGRVMLETLQGTRRKLAEYYVRDLAE